MRATDGLLALFGATSPEAREGAALLAFALIKYAKGAYPETPRNDEED